MQPLGLLQNLSATKVFFSLYFHSRGVGLHTTGTSNSFKMWCVILGLAVEKEVFKTFLDKLHSSSAYQGAQLEQGNQVITKADDMPEFGIFIKKSVGGFRFKWRWQSIPEPVAPFWFLAFCLRHKNKILWIESSTIYKSQHLWQRSTNLLSAGCLVLNQQNSIWLGLYLVTKSGP